MSRSFLLHFVVLCITVLHMGDLLHEFYKTTFKSAHGVAGALADIPIQPEMTRYRDDVAKAVKFTLGEDAMHHIVVRGTEDHTKLPLRVPLACLPFEKMWIEYDNHQRVRAQHEIGTSNLPDNGTPKRAGFLLKRVYDRPTAWIATKVFDARSGLNGLSPLVYLFDAESEHPIEVLGSFSNMIKRVAPPIGGTVDDNLELQQGVNCSLWGYSRINPHGEMLGKLFNHGAYSFEPAWLRVLEGMVKAKQWTRETTDKIITRSVAENAGDMRFLVTTLALINEVPVTYTDATQRGSFLAGGRTRNFFSNSVITLNVPAMKRRSVTQFLDRASAKAAKRKRHRVRGHWRTSDKDHGPPWGEYTDHATGKTRYRRWIEHHLRGDSSVGWVHQQYQVKQKGH